MQTGPLDEHELRLLRAVHCGSKMQLTEQFARHRAKETGLQAYRCAFSHDHALQNHEWHIGHAPDMRTLTTLARYLRERNAATGCDDGARSAQ